MDLNCPRMPVVVCDDLSIVLVRLGVRVFIKADVAPSCHDASEFEFRVDLAVLIFYQLRLFGI